MNAGMPMLELVCSMPMPSYANVEGLSADVLWHKSLLCFVFRLFDMCMFV
jgi:hypothetical protein